MRKIQGYLVLGYTRRSTVFSKDGLHTCSWKLCTGDSRVDETIKSQTKRRVLCRPMKASSLTSLYRKKKVR